MPPQSAALFEVLGRMCKEIPDNVWSVTYKTMASHWLILVALVLPSALIARMPLFFLLSCIFIFWHQLSTIAMDFSSFF